MYNAPAWPNFSEEEGEIAKRVLLSNKVNYWTGSEARHFETEFSKYFESDFAIALANGTVAMDLALKALNLSEGDEVIVTSRSFIASASTVVNSGARPVFADIDADSQNITADSIAAALTPRTKAVICVHLAGWPCEMSSIIDLCQAKNLALIEDCAQAHGAQYRGKSVGSFGDFGTWSFCQDKIMTTAGEGGMVTTNDAEMHELMWSFKDHGKSWEKVQEKTTSTTFRWIHDSIGTNWRLTEIQAAIGRHQLNELDGWVNQRRASAAILTNELKDIDGLRVTIPPEHIKHAYYKYYFFIKPDLLSAGWDRNRIVDEIVAKQIPCFTGSCPEIYRERAFTNLYGEQKRLKVASLLGDTSIMLNVHPGITREHLLYAASVIKETFKLAVK